MSILLASHKILLFLKCILPPRALCDPAPDMIVFMSSLTHAVFLFSCDFLSKHLNKCFKLSLYL